METVKVEVARARNLRSSILHLPSAVVELHTSPGLPAVATSEPVQGDANPVWGFTHEYEVNHCPPHRLSLVVIDVTRPKAPHLGRVSLDIIHPVTSGWFSLSEDESDSSEVFVTVFCKNACEGRASSSRFMIHEASNFEAGSSTQLELRQVSDSPGFLFRSGELFVKIEAIGVPQSVRQPHLKLSMRDQYLKADETQESAAAWEKILEEENAQDDEHKNIDGTDGTVNSNEENDSINPAHDDEPNVVEETSQGCGEDGAGSRTSIERGGESECRQHDEHIKKSKTLADFDVEHALDETEQAQQRRSKLLNFASVNLGSMRLGKGPRKLLRAGREAGRVRLKPFGRSKQFSEAQTGIFAAQSPSSPDNDKEERDLVQQNSEPGPQSSENSETYFLAMTSKDDVSQDAATENNANKTKWRFSPFNSAVFTDSARPKSTQSFSSFSLSSLSRRRRGVDFGTVKFAIFEGEDPVKLRVQLVDRSSKLLGPMSVYTDQTIDLKAVRELVCSCGNKCSRHVLQYQMSDRGQVNGKIVLRVLIHSRTWIPKAWTNNVTHRFLNILPRIDDMSYNFKETFPEAEELTYLLVGGLFTDHYPTYFEKNIQYLQETLRLPRVQSIPIHTEGSVERNGKIIRDSVLKTCRGSKSVVLIGHSKGGIDATAVIQTYPDVIPFLYGIITFQAPFGGTFLVDFVAQSKIAMNAIKGIIQHLWKGDREAVQDMRYSSRLKALGFFHKPIENLSNDYQRAGVRGTPLSVPTNESSQPAPTSDIHTFKRIPIISFGSFASFDLLSIRSAATAAGIASMSPAAKAILENTGFLCDGLVILNDARVPFSDFVSLDDMMHTEPALYVPGTSYPPGKLTASALVLLFENMRRRNADLTSKDSSETRVMEQTA